MGNKNYGHIKPEYLKPELSTKLYRTTFSYLSKFYSEKIFEDVCRELQIPHGFLLDSENWVSVKFGARFAQLIREKTGDPEIYRKIGHFYFSPENLSPFEYSLLKSLSPYVVLKMAEQFYRKRNAACQFKLTKVGQGNFKFEMSSEQQLYPEMAHNTLGTLEAFQKLYNLDLFSVDLEIDDSEDVHYFSLTMKFAAIQFYLKRLLFFACLLLAGATFGFILWEAEKLLNITLLPLLTCLVYLLAFLTYKLSDNLKIFRRSAEDSSNQIRDKNLNLYEKTQLLERRYLEAGLLKNLSTELVACQEPHLVIETCLESIRTKFGYQRAAVFLISQERKKLYLANSIGFENLPIDASKIEFDFPNPDKKDGFIATAIERGESSLILDIQTYKQILKPHNRGLLDALGVSSMIISPIQSAEKKFGAFVLIRAEGEPMLERQDKFLIENITSQLSLYFESASNFANESKLRGIFQKYVPKVVLDQLNSTLHSTDGSLAPKKIEICSVFMDLRGFTAACDGVAPERAFGLINLFAEFATSLMAAEGAIIDNIIGDEVVCFFQKDTVSPNEHVTRALRAANAIRTLFPEFKKKLKANGFSEMRLGIGIHCGDASVGSVGGEAKKNYTALGSTVNIASRLQSLTKKYAEADVTIIVSESIVASIPKFTYAPDRLQKEVLRGTSGQTNFLKLEDSDFERLLPSKLVA